MRVISEGDVYDIPEEIILEVGPTYDSPDYEEGAVGHLALSVSDLSRVLVNGQGGFAEGEGVVCFPDVPFEG